MSDANLLPRKLRYADAVVRLGSIQAAARELSISASAIDRQIIQLEDELGVQIFERIASGMRPTAAGQLLAVLTRRWSGDIERTVSELKQMQGVTQGKVRLAAMDSHANGLLVPFIQRLAIEHPRILLEIDIVGTDEAVRLLDDGVVEVIVTFNLKPNRDVHALWSAQLPLGCVVAPDHALAREPSTTLKQVTAYAIASQNRSLSIRRYLEKKHGWLFAGGEPPVVTNSLQLVKSLARSGHYVALTSELDAGPEILDGSLCFVPIQGKEAQPQTVDVAISARRPLTRIARLVSELLAKDVESYLASVRKVQSQSTTSISRPTKARKR